MTRIPDPLDADERALADLLARDALPGPSPQLDARILAAARSATTATTTTTASPSRRPRPRPRWIAGMSIAATLVLAIGIAWRLRPLPPQQQPARDMTVSAVRVVEPAARTASPQPPAAADAVYRQMPSPPAQQAAKAIPAERDSAAAADKASPPPGPPVVYDAPAPMDVQAPPPAPPPAPPAPSNPAANSEAASAMANAQAAKASAPAMRAATASPPNAFEQQGQRGDARTLDRIETTSAGVDAAAAADAAAEGGISRAVLDEEPPATADSPQVQEAWLQRIRELLSAGETDAARNSLAEFRRRYPKYALPEDLRPLKAP